MNLDIQLFSADGDDIIIMDSRHDVSNNGGYDESQYERYVELERLTKNHNTRVTMLGICDDISNCALYTLTSFLSGNVKKFKKMMTQEKKKGCTLNDNHLSKCFNEAIQNDCDIFYMCFQFVSPITTNEFTDNLFKMASDNKMLVIAPLGDRDMQNQNIFCWSEYCYKSPLVLIGDINCNGAINDYSNVFLEKKFQESNMRAIWTCGSDVKAFDENEVIYNGTLMASAIATRRLGILMSYYPDLHEALLGDDIWNPVSGGEICHEIQLLNHFGLWIHYQVMDLDRPNPVNIRQKQQDFVKISN